MPPTDVSWLYALLHSEHRAGWFLAVWLGGLALNLTPCVYPMIPVTLAFFTGQASAPKKGGKAAKGLGYTVALGACYMIGMALTYATLGLIAAKTGSLLGGWLQQPAVLIGIALGVIALALSMFGLYELRPPSWIAQRFGQAQSGVAGALVMGLVVGLIAAPCIGPFVLGLLLFVSEMADPVLGFWLLFTMGLGMGLPYLVLGIVSNRATWWPKAGAWLVWVKQLLGVLLLGLALSLVRPLLGPKLFQWLMVGGLLLAGAYLGWLEGSRVGVGMRWVRRLTGVALLAGAVATIPMEPRPGAAVAWQPYSHARLAQAARDGRPVLVDVYADWCVPCVEMDHVTFRDPEVIKRLEGFAALRIDATRDVPAEAGELLERSGVFGVPTLLIFDRRGQERTELRVNGFLPPKEFLKHVAPVMSDG